MSGRLTQRSAVYCERSATGGRIGVLACVAWIRPLGCLLGGLLRKGEALAHRRRPEFELVDAAVAYVAHDLEVFRVQNLNTFVPVMLVMHFKGLRTAATLARGVRELAEFGGELPFGRIFPNVKRHVGNFRLEIGSVLRVGFEA